MIAVRRALAEAAIPAFEARQLGPLDGQIEPAEHGDAERDVADRERLARDVIAVV